MTVPVDELFTYGRIVGLHGLRGDLRVRPQTSGSDALCTVDEVFLRDASGHLTCCVPVRAVLHKGLVLLRLQDHETINLAEKLVGAEVLMRLADLPELDENENYWHQIQGLTVVDRQRGELGTLQDMFATPAHDIYVVQGPFGEVLIPAVPALIIAVDLAGRRIEVDLPEGLVP
jgi:16S rRNA processing protein RimM